MPRDELALRFDNAFEDATVAIFLVTFDHGAQ
jgi:hypothetical protein